MSKEKTQQIRLANFISLKNNPQIGVGKISKLSRAISKSESLTRFYLNPDKKGGRKMGEEFARDVEIAIGVENLWMDIEHSPVKENSSTYSEKNFIYDNKHKHIKKKYIKWLEYCSDTDSIFNKTELISMLIDQTISVPDNTFIVEIDNNNYVRLQKGTLLLIDPDSIPDDKNVVILSINDRKPTLVRWLSAYGDLDIELLEKGYPGSTSLENKKYKILGTAIFIQQKGVTHI